MLPNCFVFTPNVCTIVTPYEIGLALGLIIVISYTIGLWIGTHLERKRWKQFVAIRNMAKGTEFDFDAKMRIVQGGTGPQKGV